MAPASPGDGELTAAPLPGLHPGARFQMSPLCELQLRAQLQETLKEKKRDAFERLLINARLTVVPLAQESIRRKTSVASLCASGWNKTQGVTTRLVHEKHSEEIQAFCRICSGFPTATALAPRVSPRGTSRHSHTP